MGSLMDAILGGGRNDPNKGGQGPDAIWDGRRWIPRNIAAPNLQPNRMRTQTMNTAFTTAQLGAAMPSAPGTTTSTVGPMGVPSGMPGATGTSPDATARAKYGYLAGFLNHPEIGPILREAAAKGWGEMELYGAVTQTKFWQETSAAQRTWWQLTNEDPAEAKRLVAQTAATIQNRAKTLGLPMDSGAIASLATTATANGWTDAQTVDQIMQQVNWATLESGDLTALRDDVKAIGGDYLVAVSDQTAQNYAARIASGELSIEGVRSSMLQQAKARFGWMADQLDQGMTVKDYFRPTRDVIANELGVPPEEVDLMSSKYMSLIEKRDEKTGQLRAATLDEAMLAARRDPRFANTQKAKEMTTSLMDTVTNMFGRQ